VHEESLLQLLGQAVGDTPAPLRAPLHAPRFLLSGSSDETLLRVVESACRRHCAAHITVLDTCATPLALMQAYADEAGLEIATVQADILEFFNDAQFEIILTHAFMGNFDDVQRSRLLARWRGLLADGGRIVTIQRVRSAHTPPIVSFSQRQAADFVAAALDAARRFNISARKDLARIEAAAAEFARKFSVYAIRTKAELENLFREAGLEFEHLEYHTLAEREKLSGPSVPSGGEYAHILAKKAADRGAR
jgi:ubiquinone/menaquinone biosynthesis C-methylase UbiE